MAIKTTDTTNYTNIANAIRLKNGSNTAYLPSEMATAISNIPSGGSDVATEWTECVLTNVEGSEWTISNNTATSTSFMLASGITVYPFDRDSDNIIPSSTVGNTVIEYYITTDTSELSSTFGLGIEGDTYEFSANLSTPSGWTYQEGDELFLKVIVTTLSKSGMTGTASVKIYKKYNRG